MERYLSPLSLQLQMCGLRSLTSFTSFVYAHGLIEWRASLSTFLYL